LEPTLDEILRENAAAAESSGEAKA